MASQAAVTGKRRDHIFYTGLAVVAAAIVFAGFARTYYLRDLFGGPPLPPLVHLHGALFTSWLVLLLSQVTLVAAKRTHIHRRLGVAGGVLAAFMIVVGTITAIQAARRGVTPPGGPFSEVHSWAEDQDDINEEDNQMHGSFENGGAWSGKSECAEH